MIHHNNLVLLVLVLQQLRYPLITLNVRTREVYGLLNVVLFVLLWLAEVDKQEVSVNAGWELLGFDGN
jgi:hypothetical protein